MREKEIKVVIKKVGENPVISTIKNELSVFQEIVGGYIETFFITEDIVLVLNEEGKLQGLDLNFEIPLINGYKEQIVGNVVIVSHKDCEFTSLNDTQIEFLKSVGLYQ